MLLEDIITMSFVPVIGTVLVAIGASFNLEDEQAQIDAGLIGEE